MKKFLTIVVIILTSCTILFAKENDEEYYNQLENRIYQMLEDFNDECLGLLKLTPEQTDKIYKLQIRYLEIAKKHGVILKKAYIDFDKEYRKNANSKATERKKKRLVVAVENVRKEYNRYQGELYSILTKEQIAIYEDFINRKLKELEKEWESKVKSKRK